MKKSTTLLIVMAILISYCFGIYIGKKSNQIDIESRAKSIEQEVYNSTEVEYIIFGEKQE